VVAGDDPSLANRKGRRMNYAHGHVYRVGRQWYYEARVGGVTFLRDDVNSWPRAFELCMRDVAALNRIYGAGHHLKHSYAHLVERARGL
jgi:hypothetical protein